MTMVGQKSEDESERRVPINKDLKRKSVELFKGMRPLEMRGYKYVWCKKSTIYARKLNYSDSIRLRDLDDVRNLLQG